MAKPHEHIAVYTETGTCLTPFGLDLPNQVDKIKAEETAIKFHHRSQLDEDGFYGAIIDDQFLSKRFAELNIKGEFSRLEQMMMVVLQPLIKKFKNHIKADCGIVFSTTKGNIDALEHGENSSYFLADLAKKVTKGFGLKAEPIVVSNACVSGIMAVSVAKRMIKSGQFKHCIVVGGDLFSRFVFSGFQSFKAISDSPCKPYDKDRDGITLGEAAAALFMSCEKKIFESETIYEVTGGGSINDANHISGPSRTGEGLFQSIQSALSESGTKPLEIDCISAHGTATNYNDEMEAQAFNRLHLEKTPVFSLKSIFGHTLGAAGLLETVISLAFADQNLIPPSLGYQNHGLTLPLQISPKTEQKEIRTILKTASGFGGANTAIVLEKHKNNDA